MFIDFKERVRNGERHREKHWCERNIHQLPPRHALTADQTRHLSMPWPGIKPIAFSCMGRHSNQLSTWPGMVCYSFFFVFKQSIPKSSLIPLMTLLLFIPLMHVLNNPIYCYYFEKLLFVRLTKNKNYKIVKNKN